MPKKIPYLKLKYKDKRKSERLSIPLKMEYKVLPRQKILIETFSRDISGGGLRITLDHPLKIKDRLKTILYFPNETHPITAISKVIWCKRNKEDKNAYDIGIKYIKVIPKDRDRFVFLFCEMMVNYFVLGTFREHAPVK